MRVLLERRSSTKPERIFAEILKNNHISFLWRDKIQGHEIDFIIGKYAIEIDGHQQSSERNKMIIDAGFSPIHYKNEVLLKNREVVEKDILTKIWHSQQSHFQEH